MTSRGYKAEIQRERRDNVGEEYRRKLKTHLSKQKDFRDIEQIIAKTPDCWKMIKKIKLSQRKRNNPTTTLNEEDKANFESFWQNMYSA